MLQLVLRRSAADYVLISENCAARGVATWHDVVAVRDGPIPNRDVQPAVTSRC